MFLGSSPDLPFAGTDHWCPHEAADPIFANRAAAERLMGIDYLTSRNGKTRNGKVIEISGAGVNVAIVDQGLNAEQLGENYATGWAVAGTRPGTAKPPPGSIRRSHGMMIADNIRKVAPAVKFFDLPLLPSKISNIQPFLSLALAAFIEMLDDIDAVRADAMWLGYSAQGPGQSNLETGKPDLCAPAELKRILSKKARKPAGLRKSKRLRQRFGNGILNAKAVLSKMP